MFLFVCDFLKPFNDFPSVLKPFSDLPTQTVAFQCLFDVLSSSLDKTSIRQLQVAVPLRLNIVKRVT